MRVTFYRKVDGELHIIWKGAFILHFVFLGLNLKKKKIKQLLATVDLHKEKSTARSLVDTGAGCPARLCHSAPRIWPCVGLS